MVAEHPAGGKPVAARPQGERRQTRDEGFGRRREPLQDHQDHRRGVHGVLVRVPLPVRPVEILVGEVQTLGKQRPPAFGVRGRQEGADLPAPVADPGDQQLGRPPVRVRRSGGAARVPQGPHVGQGRQPVPGRLPGAVRVPSAARRQRHQGVQLPRQVRVRGRRDRGHGHRRGRRPHDTARRAQLPHADDGPAQQPLPVRVRCLGVHPRPGQRLLDRLDAAVEVGQPGDGVGQPVGRGGPQVGAQHLDLAGTVQTGQRGQRLRPHASVDVHREPPEEVHVRLRAVRAADGGIPPGEERQPRDDVREHVGVPGEERGPCVAVQQHVAAAHRPAWLHVQQGRQREPGRGTGRHPARDGDLLDQVRGPPLPHVRRAGRVRGAAQPHDVVGEHQQPGRLAAVRGPAGRRVRHLAEPGEHVGRRGPVDRPPGGVGAPPGPAGMRCGDGLRQVGRVVTARLSHHLRAARPIAQQVQDLRSGSLQHVVDHGVVDLGHLERRETVPYRVRPARHGAVGDVLTSPFTLECVHIGSLWTPSDTPPWPPGGPAPTLEGTASGTRASTRGPGLGSATTTWRRMT
nr:hypothetical protein GCM10025730_06770 [Promicromonospora thailandica]